MNNYNKLFVALVAFAVAGVTGPDAWAVGLWPEIPTWIVTGVGALGVWLIPNGQPFWRVMTPGR